MAKGTKTGGRNFEPGNKLGRGAVAHNPVVKTIRRMTQDDIAEFGSMLLSGDVSTLRAIKENPDGHSVLKTWLASVVIKAIDKGDVHAMSALLDRIVGKAPQVMQVTPLSHLSDEELIQEAKKLMIKIQALDDVAV